MTELLAGWSVERRLASSEDRIVARARRSGGDPVIVKATVPGASWRDRAGLRHEGRLLDQLQGTGVVELLDVVDTRGRTALVLRFVPLTAAGRPGADLQALRPIVERLHRTGVIHGALQRAHVLLTADGAPVLCGFGAADRSPSTAKDLADLARVLGELETMR